MAGGNISSKMSLKRGERGETGDKAESGGGSWVVEGLGFVVKGDIQSEGGNDGVGRSYGGYSGREKDGDWRGGGGRGNVGYGAGH